MEEEEEGGEEEEEEDAGAESPELETAGKKLAEEEIPVRL